MNEKVINLTPHSVTVFQRGYEKERKSIAYFPPSGEVARVSEELKFVTWTRPEECARLFQLVTSKRGEAVDLPRPKKGTVYIVSAMVRAAKPRRKDLWSPAELVRSEDGRVIGCLSFEVNV